MTAWGVAKAKAQFSAVLDKAESEGPQLVKRRNREFLIMTKEQAAQQTALSTQMPFRSAWGALRPSSRELFDVDFPRLRSESEPMPVDSPNADCSPSVEMSGAALWNALRLPPKVASISIWNARDGTRARSTFELSSRYERSVTTLEGRARCRRDAMVECAHVF